MSVFETLTLITSQSLYWVAAALGFGFVIGFHELGHFLFCKLFSVSTPTFSIGFGPQLVQKKIGETNFTLSAIPFGGYVEIAGNAEIAQGDQKEATRDDDYSFAKKPWYQKFLIMCGGICFNLFFAYVTLLLLFMSGMPTSMMFYPHNTTPVISRIVPGSPAQQAGFQAGDVVVAMQQLAHQAPATDKANQTTAQDGAVRDTSVHDTSNQSALSYAQQLLAAPHERFLITVSRPVATPSPDEPASQTDSVQSHHEMTLETQSSVASTGIIFQIGALEPRSLTQAHHDTVQLFYALTAGTLQAFKTLFGGNTKDIGGPVQMLAETARGARSGIKSFFLLLALISISIAIMNLIPLPILDGGQILFCTIESIIRRPLPLKIREYIHIASWLLILPLMLLVTARDIYCLLSPYCVSVLAYFGF
jgi:regulator of sigma E protease